MRYLLALLIILLFSSGCSGQAPLTDRIKSAGLEIEGVRTLQATELPPGAKSGKQFVLPTHCGGCGGKILEFGNEVDAQRMAEIWRGMAQHVYVKGGTLLQINGTVTADIANQYGEVLLK